MPSYTGAGHTFGSGGRSLGPATPPRAWSASMGRSAADARASVPPLAVRTPASPSSRLPPRYERNYGHHDGSDRDSEKSAPSAAAPAPAGAPAAGKATDKDADWRAMFRSSKGGTMGGGESTSGGGARAFRTAVVTAYGRSKLYGSSSQADNKDRDANDKEARWSAPAASDSKKASGGGGGGAKAPDSYRAPSQAGWARERLMGKEPPRSAEDLEEAAQDERVATAVAQAWVAGPSAWVPVSDINAVQDMLRRRLDELEKTGRAARTLFADCDASGRGGRVCLHPFVETMTRRLNYEFGANQRGQDTPSSRDVLAATFRRYDLERSGAVAFDDFVAALTCESRNGHARGRVVNAIGRLREGIVRQAGGYDALDATEDRWFGQQEGCGLPIGIVQVSDFVEGVARLAQSGGVPLTEADLVTLYQTFEPPRAELGEKAARAVEKAQQACVSYFEFALALRGPSMNANRLDLVRQAYAACKDDAKGGKPVKPHHLADRYDASLHPAVRAGDMEESEASVALLGVWMGSLDDEVKAKDFIDRYEAISLLFEDDATFEDMMEVAWLQPKKK